MRTRCCHGISRSYSRRAALQIGCLSAFGLGLADIFRDRIQASESDLKTATDPKCKSCILLWLDGGPSHLETFDPKPDTPSEVRGPFSSIATNVPGVRLCELLPRTAQRTDKIAIVRSMTSPLGEHGLAHHYLLTGYTPSPVLQYPSYGSVVAHLSSGPTVLPRYVAIPEERGAGSGFLGRASDPFVTKGDPAHADFRVQDVDFYPGVDARRLARRREFLAEFDRAQSDIESGEGLLDPSFEQAYRLVTSPQAKQAFDLTAEAPELRANYGPRTFGQSCLLARRLVERGVAFVTVHFTGWDTHEALVLQLRDGYTGAREGVGLIPTFDMGFSALLDDLSTRNMLDETLVIAMGEFGRTPKLNTRGGRDHWPRVFSVVLAGGGVRGGQVIGASDRVGESPVERPVTPSDLAHTLYRLLGIDPNHELQTADGRPIPVNRGGQFIRELAT